MSGAFSVCYHGEAGRAADVLETMDEEASNDMLKAALVNALRRIEWLENALEEIRERDRACDPAACG